MTETLEYASPTTRPALPLWQRLTLIPLYYLGWTVGWAVWLTYLTIVAANAVRDGSASMVLTYASLALGGVAGAVLGYLARRRRWPQWLIMGLGVPATAFAAYAVVDVVYRTPRGFLWEFFFRLALIGLAGGLGLLLAGFTGLVLTRRQ